MKKMLMLIGFHCLTFALSACLFVALFALGPKIESSHFFFRGVLYCIIAGCFSACVMFFVKSQINEIVYQDIALAFTSTALILLVFFTHIPVTADRSLTIYLLGKMNSNPERIYKKSELEHLLIQQYIVEYNAVQKRADEQVIVGTIENGKEGYKITQKGERLIGFYQILAKVFQVNSKLTNPKKGQEDENQ